MIFLLEMIREKLVVSSCLFVNAKKWILPLKFVDMQGFCDISLISINLNTVEALSYYFKSKYYKPSLYNQLKSSFYLT
jgi:hypothetical protein